MPPDIPDLASEGIGAAALRVLIEIALHQDDPAERNAMLSILHSDGWLTDDDHARLCLREVVDANPA